MKPVEQVKIITGETVEDVETRLNEWYLAITAKRRENTAIANIPLKITGREFSFLGNKNPSYAVAIFYEDFALEKHEQGSPKMQGSQKGVSAVAKNNNLAKE